MTNSQALRECEVFSALGDAKLEKVAAFTTEKEYEAGTTLFEEGESSEELLLVQEGKVALQVILPKALMQVSRRITVYIVTNNEIIGWSAIVEPYVHILTAVCLQKIKVLSINGSKLRWLLQDDHEIGYEIFYKLIKVVALRLDDTRHLLISERSLP